MKQPGKQIVMALLRLAFDKFGATGVYYDCFAENTALKALALACGFSYAHSGSAELKKNGEAVILDYYHISEEK